MLLSTMSWFLLNEVFPEFPVETQVEAALQYDALATMGFAQ